MTSATDHRASAPEAPIGAAPSLGHHGDGHDGHDHAGARRHRDQRGAPAHAGFALGRRRRGVLGADLLPRGQRRDPARHRLARRRARAQALLRLQHDRVHGRLGPLRPRAEPDHAPDRAHAPGHRRRPADAAVPGHHVGDLPVPAARHGHGGLGHGHHDGADLRPDPRRMDRRQLVVALDLLHQRADRGPRHVRGERRALRSAVPEEAGRRRCPRPRADGDRVPVAPALPRPG